MSIKTNNFPKEPADDSFNLKEIAFKVLKRWPYYLISILVFLAASYAILKISTPIYKLKASVLIKDDKNFPGGAFMEETQLFGGKNNLENEIGLLSSRFMMVKALEKLDFDVSYFIKEKFTVKQLYNKVPFKVTLDTSHVQVFYAPVYITLLNNKEYEVEIKEEEKLKGSINNYETLTPIERVRFKSKGQFGIPFSNDHFKFTIDLITPAATNAQGEYYFHINIRENIVDSYQERLAASPINKKASIVELSLSGSVVEKEKVFLNSLLDVYIKNGLDEKNRTAINTIRFIDEQLIGVTDSLKTAEEDLQLFRSENNVIDVTTSNKMLIEKLEQLSTEKAIINLKFKYYNYLRGYISNNMQLNEVVAPSAMGIEDPLLNTQIQELVKLSTNLSALQMSSTDKNPYLGVQQERIKSVKATLLENLNNIISTSKISLKDINERIDVVQKEVNKLPDTERKLVGIQRRFVFNDNIYNYLLQKRAEAGIAKAANTPDNVIIDDARLVSKTPIYPRKPIFYLGALIFGFAVPFIGFGIFDFINNTISSVPEFEKMSTLPIIARIGHSNDKEKLINQNPKSSLAESFRSARINLQYLAPQLNKKIIGITSSVSGEGKTFFSVNLAIAISLLNKRTLLIGADLRKPALSEYFSLDKTKGFTTFLIDKHTTGQVIQKTNINNLDIIFSGPIPPNPSELLNSPKIEDMFNELKNDYDYIIIDSAPVGLVSDYYSFLNYVDINLYVVRIDYTTKEMVKKLNNLYQLEKFKNFSIILNDTHNVSNQYGYGYTEEKKEGNLKKLSRAFKLSV